MPQDPLKGVTAGASGSVDPCAGVEASDLDYFKSRERAGGKIENGLDHITRNHILLDDSKTKVLTPERMPILAQSKSKYLFQNGTTLEVAQDSIVRFNAYLFDAAKATGNYEVQSWNGNIRMSIRFPGPVVDNKGKIYAGLGYDKKDGWLPTNRAFLILGPDCKEVITSSPGR